MIRPGEPGVNAVICAEYTDEQGNLWGIREARGNREVVETFYLMADGLFVGVCPFRWHFNAEDHAHREAGDWELFWHSGRGEVYGSRAEAMAAAPAVAQREAMKNLERARTALRHAIKVCLDVGCEIGD